MKKIFHKRNEYIAVFLLCINFVYSQNTEKVGGICFRIDDNQPMDKWESYSQIFKKYNYNFSFSPNLGDLENNVHYFIFFRELQALGHELMDHTPNHETHRFTVPDVSTYLGKQGIDHITGNVIYLQFTVDSSIINRRDGFASIKNNILVSVNAGAFSKFLSAGVFYTGVYLPSLNQTFSVGKVMASNSLDVDSVQLLDFWGDLTVLNDNPSVEYVLVTQYDINIPVEGRHLLSERTLSLCKKFGIDRPFTWVQPGGRWPVFSRAEQRVLSEDGYSSGTGLPDVSLKCYNEYDKENDKRFGMQWGDFNEEIQYFARLKNFIADRIARHFILTGHSHFALTLGNWADYLLRTDSLLAWCKKNAIPVKTQNEWATILYSTEQNPYVNVFPPLNVDLDENGVPDGYYNKSAYTDGKLNTTDSPNEILRYSYSISKIGSICYISGLAGLEKGDNDFYICTKGSPGDSVEVEFSFPEKNWTSIKLKFPATSSDWIRYGIEQSVTATNTLTIPFDVSYCDVRISCSNYSSGIVKVGGFELRKKIIEPLRIISLPQVEWQINSDYQYKVNIVSKFRGDTLSYQMQESPDWLSINQQGFLSGRTRSRIEPVTVRFTVSDQHQNSDSQSYVLRIHGNSDVTINSRNINFGRLLQLQKKDSVIIFKNIGDDTLKISSVFGSDTIISCIYDPIVRPRSESEFKVSILPKPWGSVNGSLFIYSNSPTSPDTISVTGYIGSTNQQDEIVNHPLVYSLSQNYPNPFNAGTIISYDLASESKVSIIIYNVLGQVVKTLESSQIKSPGNHRANWRGDGNNGSSLGTSLYFCRMTAIPQDGSSQKEIVRKMLLIR